MTTPNNQPGPVSWVLTDDDLSTLLEAIAGSHEVVMDLETTGLTEHAFTGGPSNGGVASRVAVASFTLPQRSLFGDPSSPWDENEPVTYVIPLSHLLSPFRGVWRATLRKLAQAIADYERPLTNANVKFDARWIFATTGVDLAHLIWWDTQVSSHLLDENRSTRLKVRAPETFGIDPWDDGINFSKPGAAEKIDLFHIMWYAALDTYWTWRLAKAHREQMYLPYGSFNPQHEPPQGREEVQDARIGTVAELIAMPTVQSLTRIEQRGFRVDSEYVREHLAEDEKIASETIDALADRYDMPRETASMAATSNWFKQFAEHAIEDGQLRISSLTPSGNPQWSKGVLKRQARAGSEVAEQILTARKSIKSAEFYRSWLSLVSREGTIHSTYWPGRVVTGRLCISPDSLIEMPRDMTKYPDGVPLRDIKEGDWVYSFDHHMELTLRQVEWVGATKIDRTVIVTFENSAGEQRTLQCTPDHLVRLYNGDWRHAEYLLRNVAEDGLGPRVLSMVRRGWKEPNGNDRYLQFYPHSNSRHTPPSVSRGARYGSTSGGKNTEHRWIMEKVLGKKLSTKWDVNHIDGNKVNNHPSNLEYLPASEHRSNTHRDGTWGKEQPGTDTYIGPNDFRVVSIEEGPTIEVWDMTIPEDHQFIANGIVVHNSSTDPNMQQVSRALRPAFIPRPGFVIADFDYSQIELRVAAFISRCQPMLDAYNRGDDLHRMLAAQISRKPIEEVTKQERQDSKAGNFGFLYGMAAEGFVDYADDAYDVQYTLDEAVTVRQGFFQLWDGLTEWHLEAISTAREFGEIVSPLGRVRRLPNIHSSNSRLRSDDERRAINSPVQGMASDLLMMAAASMQGFLFNSKPIEGLNLVATVHDSLVAEVPEDRWEEVCREVIDRMGSLDYYLNQLGVNFDVPLLADASVGTRWGLTDVGEIE